MRRRKTTTKHKEICVYLSELCWFALIGEWNAANVCGDTQFYYDECAKEYEPLFLNGRGGKNSASKPGCVCDVERRWWKINHEKWSLLRVLRASVSILPFAPSQFLFVVFISWMGNIISGIAAGKKHTTAWARQWKKKSNYTIFITIFAFRAEYMKSSRAIWPSHFVWHNNSSRTMAPYKTICTCTRMRRFSAPRTMQTRSSR